MGKVVDITEKLSFDENPKLRIKGVEYEVNADAATMLKIMGVFAKKNEAEAVVESYELMFEEKERKKIDKLKLTFQDFKTLIGEAMELIQGGSEPGEQ